MTNQWKLIFYQSIKELLNLHSTCNTMQTFGERAFKKAVPDLWNELPLSLRLCGTIQE